VVRGCSPIEALRSVGNPAGRCASLSNAPASLGQEVQVADADFLVRRLALDAQQASTLRGGGLVLLDPTGAVRQQVGDGAVVGSGEQLNQTRVDVVDGSVVFAVGSGRLGTGESPVVGGDARTVRVAAVRVPADRFRAVTTDENVSALVASSTAGRLGWPTAPRQLAVDGPGGRPITDAEEQAMEQARSDDVILVVERGYQRSDALVIAVAFGVIAVLILVSTLTATALGQAENAPFLGTLAAVGATRGTRRLIAGAQAASSAFLGALVGALIGLVPGAALAIPLTSGSATGRPVFAVPWTTLAGLVLIVPVLAAALAAAGIRRAPVVTRRPT
jgi:putative ABC transport system permease protein